MKLSTIIFALFSLQGFNLAVAQTAPLENTAKFTVTSPIGRAIVQNSGKNKFYLGYFCLEMGKDESQKDICKKTQFGRGLDLRLGVDFMGNKTGDVGTWGPVGPVFDKKTGDEFYLNALSAKNAEDFQDIWSAVWNQEGYNWAEHPVGVKRSKMDKFIDLLSTQNSVQTKVTVESAKVCLIKKVDHQSDDSNLVVVNEFGVILEESDFKPLSVISETIAQYVKEGKCNQFAKLKAHCRTGSSGSMAYRELLDMTVGTTTISAWFDPQQFDAGTKFLVDIGSCDKKIDNF